MKKRTKVRPEKVNQYAELCGAVDECMRSVRDVLKRNNELASVASDWANRSEREDARLASIVKEILGRLDALEGAPRADYTARMIGILEAVATVMVSDRTAE